MRPFSDFALILYRHSRSSEIELLGFSELVGFWFYFFLIFFVLIRALD